MFSEMVKIPYTEIENASRLVFNMKFPESENEENEHGDPATQVVFGDIFKNGKKILKNYFRRHQKREQNSRSHSQKLRNQRMVRKEIASNLMAIVRLSWNLVREL